MLNFDQFTYTHASISRVDGNAADLKDYLAAQGIMVRYYSSPEQLASCIRISVGKPEHTDALISALEEYMSGEA